VKHGAVPTWRVQNQMIHPYLMDIIMNLQNKENIENGGKTDGVKPPSCVFLIMDHLAVGNNLHEFTVSDELTKIFNK
jgi:hypothetical protein